MSSSNGTASFTRFRALPSVRAQFPTAKAILRLVRQPGVGGNHGEVGIWHVSHYAK